ncbi:MULTISPECIES: hypothetical protein [Halobacterium]|uniref:DUF5789 family protein n=1 Tax=Halobacterium TaxID=2239 RepID=UPI00073F8C84|nr:MULTISPECIES: hypothetical protein [Halobacterium]MCG1002079.1 DUF2795 domain-containing protein [Halobacterium noricense]
MGTTVTLDELEAELRDESYPLDREAVVEEYGDYDLDLPGGEESVADVLARVGGDGFESHADLLATIEGGVGGEAVGRRDYTDRGASAGEGGGESF